MMKKYYGFSMLCALLVTIALCSSSAGAQPPMPNMTPPAIFLSATPSAIVADGTSTATITATLWDGEYWVVAGFAVSFSTGLGTITPSVPLNASEAQATLTAGTTAGTATVTAEVNMSGDIGLLTNTTTVTFTSPGGSPTPTPGGGGGGGGGGGTTTPTPTTSPTGSPTAAPSVTPTGSPTATPTGGPTASPTATPAPTATPTATPAGSPTASPKTGIPGFEAVFSIAGLTAIAYLLLRRRAD